MNNNASCFHELVGRSRDGGRTMHARRAFLRSVAVMSVSAVLAIPGLVSGSTLGLPFVTVQARGLAPSQSA